MLDQINNHFFLSRKAFITVDLAVGYTAWPYRASCVQLKDFRNAADINSGKCDFKNRYCCLLSLFLLKDYYYQ